MPKYFRRLLARYPHAGVRNLSRMVYRLFFFEPLRDLMFLSTTKFGRTKEDEDQKPYPVLPHRSSPP
jgi:hypothetical protein